MVASFAAPAPHGWEIRRRTLGSLGIALLSATAAGLVEPAPSPCAGPRAPVVSAPDRGAPDRAIAPVALPPVVLAALDDWHHQRRARLLARVPAAGPGYDLATEMLGALQRVERAWQHGHRYRVWARFDRGAVALEFRVGRSGDALVSMSTALGDAPPPADDGCAQAQAWLRAQRGDDAFGLAYQATLIAPRGARTSDWTYVFVDGDVQLPVRVQAQFVDGRWRYATPEAVEPPRPALDPDTARLVRAEPRRRCAAPQDYRSWPITLR
ncbi:MAG: hypothetical protein JNK64_40340 [Myxococcales bacterium]|nr:hypothetical protein [Myxococcales bacterium]